MWNLWVEMRGNWAMLASDMFNCIDKQKLGINHSFERNRGYLAVFAIELHSIPIWILSKHRASELQNRIFLTFLPIWKTKTHIEKSNIALSPQRFVMMSVIELVDVNSDKILIRNFPELSISELHWMVHTRGTLLRSDMGFIEDR